MLDEGNPGERCEFLQRRAMRLRKRSGGGPRKELAGSNAAERTQRKGGESGEFSDRKSRQIAMPAWKSQQHCREKRIRNASNEWQNDGRDSAMTIYSLEDGGKEANPSSKTL